MPLRSRLVSGHEQMAHTPPCSASIASYCASVMPNRVRSCRFRSLSGFAARHAWRRPPALIPAVPAAAVADRQNGVAAAALVNDGRPRQFLRPRQPNPRGATRKDEEAQGSWGGPGSRSTGPPRCALAVRRRLPRTSSAQAPSSSSGPWCARASIATLARSSASGRGTPWHGTRPFPARQAAPTSRAVPGARGRSPAAGSSPGAVAVGWTCAPGRSGTGSRRR